MTKKKDDPFRIEYACDDLLTDESILEDVRWKIGRNLEALQDTNFPDELLVRCGLLPDSFRFSIKKKLNQPGIDDDESIRACRLVFDEIEQLEKLLMKDGIVDREAATIYFHSMQLFFNLFRAGTLAETVQREEERREAYKDGPGAASREAGNASLKTVEKILKEVGGIAGYDALPHGKKTPIKNKIAKALHPRVEAPSTRNVDNLLNKIRIKQK